MPMKDQIIVFRCCHQSVKRVIDWLEHADKSAVLAELHAHHTLMGMSRILNTPRNTLGIAQLVTKSDMY